MSVDELIAEGREVADDLGLETESGQCMEKLVNALEASERNYEGAMSDIFSLLNVLVRRINSEADLISAAEWVRLNYPVAAEKIKVKPNDRI